MATDYARSRPDLLLHGGTVLDPYAETTIRADVLIREGCIAEVAPNLDATVEAAVPRVDCSGQHISPGWVDMHVHLREPGFEHKETIASGTRAAAFGGFTEIACMPNTNPPLDTRASVGYVAHRAEEHPVAVHPIGCVSKERAGETLAEMASMMEEGAVAFSDDGAPVYNAGLMRRALEYSTMLDAPIINHMEEPSLNPNGHMHEGAVATRLGIPGIPACSEDVMIARDVELARLTGGHVHVAHIATARGVELVRRAKSDGIEVTAEVCTHHLALTDEAVEASGLSTHTKMHPPLRSAADVDALKAGLADGTIDAICTDHAPHAPHEKDVPFPEAPNGILGLETAWGLVGRELLASGVCSLMQAVQALAVAPRRILRLPAPTFEPGAAANLTVFDPDTRWTFTERHIRSKSRNTPFVDAELVGKAHGIYREEQWVVCDEVPAR
ncbi:MAG: dihydroorotase [Longimonas sp.]|uniref:dihydroorotase n=1 Tax=Longimonas sp. TaxID=2039626 RepID=UPI0033597BC4